MKKLCILYLMLWLIVCVDVFARRAARTTFIGNVDVQPFTSVLGLGFTNINLANGGYTNGQVVTNVYRLGATNSNGRLPVSDTITNIFTAGTGTNATRVTWRAKGGAEAYIVERSPGGGNSFTQNIVVLPAFTNFLDIATNLWIDTLYTNDFPLLPGVDIDFTGAQNVDVPAPTASTHAATRQYVDDQIGLSTNLTLGDLTNVAASVDSAGFDFFLVARTNASGGVQWVGIFSTNFNDNLGDHIATQNLNMGGFRKITNMAAGIEEKDAVNFGLLQLVTNDINTNLIMMALNSIGFGQLTNIEPSVQSAAFNDILEATTNAEGLVVWTNATPIWFRNPIGDIVYKPLFGLAMANQVIGGLGNAVGPSEAVRLDQVQAATNHTVTNFIAGSTNVGISTWTNVAESADAPSDNDILVYDSATGLWTPEVSAVSGDNLGNHTATQILNMDGFFISGDGDTEGIFVQTNGSIGIGTNAPEASAVLDISSTNKGFLSPRMTPTQRDAITNPASGLIVYDNSNNNVDYFNGTAWRAILNTPITTLSSGSVIFATGPAEVDDDAKLVWDNNLKRFIVDGQVLIGASSSASQLHVEESAAGNNAIITLRHSNNTNNSGAFLSLVTAGASGGNPSIAFSISNVGDWGMGVDNADADKFKISTTADISGTTRFTIQRDGKVGIGTTTPGEKLEISGGNILIKNTSATANTIIDRTDGKSISILVGTDGSALKFDSTSTRFDISSETPSNILAGAGGFGTSIMSFLTNGNTGIGVTDPDAKLKSTVK